MTKFERENHQNIVDILMVLVPNPAIFYDKIFAQKLCRYIFPTKECQKLLKNIEKNQLEIS